MGTVESSQFATPPAASPWRGNFFIPSGNRGLGLGNPGVHPNSAQYPNYTASRSGIPARPPTLDDGSLGGLQYLLQYIRR